MLCKCSCQIRTELEQHMNCNLKEYKEFIDNEMLLILGQMDKPTLIFDHVYLVRQLLMSLTSTETCCDLIVLEKEPSHQDLKIDSKLHSLNILVSFVF